MLSVEFGRQASVQIVEVLARRGHGSVDLLAVDDVNLPRATMARSTRHHGRNRPGRHEDPRPQPEGACTLKARTKNPCAYIPMHVTALALDSRCVR